MRAARRNFLIATSGLVAGIGVLAVSRPAHATPAEMEEAMRTVTGGAPIRTGRVQLVIPPLVENGNSVTLTVAVESPMTPGDFVKAIHVFTEKNPQPNVVSAYLGPRAGRAVLSTRIRLAATQTVTAIAETSDGTFWSGTAAAIVTLAACLEEV